MLPAQRSFTIFAAVIVVGLVSSFVYEVIAGTMEWQTALVFTVATVLIFGFRYGYWMMRIEEREQRKAAKDSGRTSA
jgi:predicted Na+-dependent transporter